MPGELATGYVQILPSMDGFKSALEGGIGNASGEAGKKSGSLFSSTMKKYISAAAIGGAVFKSLTEGAALEQSLGGIETLYKDHADTVIAYADAAWKNAGISANNYMEQSTSFAAALIGSLGGDTKKAAEAANTAIQDMADNSAKMGTPIESLQLAYQGFARNQYQLLDNLKLGYGGVKSEMERLLSDAEKISGVKYDINNLSDVYSAIHVIQEEMNLTGVAAAEASTTLSGSFNALKASATNLIGDLALNRNIEPAMKALSESAGTFLFNNLIPAIGNIFKSLPAAIGTFLYDGLPQLLSSAQSFIESFVDAFANSGDIISKAFGGLVDLSQVILNMSGGIIGAGLKLATNLAQGIAQGLPTIIQSVPTIVSNLADVINNNAPMVIASGVKIAGTLALGIIKAIPTLVTTIPSIFRALIKVWSALNWANLGKMALTKIGSGIASQGKIVLNAVKGIINKIKGMFPFNVGKIFSNIKLPKITASGGKAPWGLLGEGTPPKFKVKWNAEGGIFDKASIIGYGVGEAGAEAIVPLDKLWQKMDAIADNNGGGKSMTLVVNFDGKTIAQKTIEYANEQTIVFGMNPILV